MIAIRKSSIHSFSIPDRFLRTPNKARRTLSNSPVKPELLTISSKSGLSHRSPPDAFERLPASKNPETVRSQNPEIVRRQTCQAPGKILECHKNTLMKSADLC